MLLAFDDDAWTIALAARAKLPSRARSPRFRLRTNKTKGCLSRDTALAMVFKLVKSAERHWRRLNGTNRLGEIIDGKVPIWRADQKRRGSRRRMTAIHKICA